jgi:hypothetical protein
LERSTGVTITAIAAALGAVLGFVFLALFLLTLRAEAVAPAGVNQAFLRIGQFIALTMFGLLGIWAGFTSVGLWKLKPWARWSVLVYAGLLICVSVPAALLIWFVPIPPTPNTTEETLRMVRWTVMGVYGALTFFSALLLYYFNRASVRAQFEGGVAIHVDRRPLSITLIGAYLILSGITCGAWIFFPVPAILLGMVFGGIPARLFYCAYAAALILIGIGLIKLRPASRIAAIALLVFGIVNSVLFLLLPGLDDRMQAVTSWFTAGLPVNTLLASTPFTIGALGFGLAIVGVLIWLLVRNRSAFEPPPTVEPTS